MGYSTNRSRVSNNTTNHSQGQATTMTALAPGTSVSCVVRIPAGVTNELILLSYLPKTNVVNSLSGKLTDLMNSLLRRAGGTTIFGRGMELYPLCEPFGATVKP